MNLLAIETATEACSVAVWRDGAVCERFGVVPRRHAELVLPWCDEVLAASELSRNSIDAIAVGRGPGAFTGVRLAIAVVQGIALALDRPVLLVSTLEVLAAGANAVEGDHVLAAIDARMGEVYWATYVVRDGELLRQTDERVSAPVDVHIDGSDWLGFGTGFAAREGALATRLAAQLTRVDAEALPHAADLAAIAARQFSRGQGIPAELVEPAYLRNNVALTIAEQQALRAQRDTG